MEKMIARVGETPNNVEEGGVLAPSTVVPLNLEVHWRLWLQMARAGQPGLEELRALRDDALSFGHVSLPEHALAVLAVARERETYGLSAADAEALVQMAMTMAPQLPYPALELARLRIIETPTAPHRAIAPLVEGVRRGAHWLDSKTSWTLKLCLLFLTSALVSFGAFMLAQLLRYFGVAAYDGARMLPRGFSSNQTVIVLVALVIVPGLVLRSPLMSMLIMLALVIPFQRLNERAVSAAFLALILALPSLDSALSHHVLYPGSPAQELSHTHQQFCDTDCLQRAETTLKQGASPVETYAAAVALFRTGQPAAMARIVELGAGESSQSPLRLRAQWENLIGAALATQGNPEEALRHFERAAELMPNAAAPVFNQMRALQLAGDVESGYDALDQAVRHDLAMVSRYLDTSRRDANSLLIIMMLSADQIWSVHKDHASTQPAVSLISPIWTALAGPMVPLSRAPFLAGFGLLWLLMTLQLPRSNRVSSPCPKCGLARDPEDADRLGGHHYCLPCYQTFVSGATLDYHARVHSETSLGRRDRFQSFLRRALSLLLPGTGHTLGGHAIRGTLAFGLLSFGALWWLYPMGLWRVATELFDDRWGGQLALATVMIALGALMGLFGCFRGIEPTRVSPSAKREDA
ncbi:tetratricopeptide repeat protein [Lujinxingia litoralis]|nr:tetratricopeptide repeat protein [Lujinxingia litoralis]